MVVQNGLQAGEGTNAQNGRAGTTGFKKNKQYSIRAKNAQRPALTCWPLSLVRSIDGDGFLNKG